MPQLGYLRVGKEIEPILGSDVLTAILGAPRLVVGVSGGDLDKLHKNINGDPSNCSTCISERE
jgi:hypothetical protein